MLRLAILSVSLDLLLDIWGTKGRSQTTTEYGSKIRGGITASYHSQQCQVPSIRIKLERPKGHAVKAGALDNTFSGTKREQNLKASSKGDREHSKRRTEDREGDGSLSNRYIPTQSLLGEAQH